MGDIIAVMREGKLVQCGNAASLFNAPADEFVMALFGAVNRFEGVIRDGAVATPFGALKFDGGQEGEKANVFFHRDSSPFSFVRLRRIQSFRHPPAKDRQVLAGNPEP